jgi:hypothetical protein
MRVYISHQCNSNLPWILPQILLTLKVIIVLKKDLGTCILQSLFTMLLEWKINLIGRSNDGMNVMLLAWIIQLFDFNCCSQISLRLRNHLNTQNYLKY